jgi:pimeloyl-ACP methyl ester carboxylesterase
VTIVRTPDRRDLEVHVEGPGEGDVLVFHHGTPGAALLPPGLAEAAAARGLRTVVHARPGYGESSPQPGRRVADAAADTATVLDSLGVDRFLTLGWSGGGPHALACAALLPDRCRVAGSVCGVAPYRAFGAGWTDGMGESNVEEFTAAAHGREELMRVLDGSDRSEVTADELLDQISSLFPPVDVEAWRGGIGEYHLAGSRQGTRHGLDGWLDDDLAFMAPWDFDLARIGVPVVVWHGAQDHAVPFTHGTWLASQVAGARAILTEDHGHLSLVARPDLLLDELL